MKELIILGRSVKVDVDKLSKGLCELHEEDEDKKAVLAFGMLDAQLCEIMEKQLKESIIKEFSPEAYDLFKLRIDQFASDCNNEVAKGVYRYAKMIA